MRCEVFVLAWQVQRTQQSGASLNTLSEEAIPSDDRQDSGEYRRAAWQPPLSVLQSYPVKTLPLFAVAM